MQRNLSISIPHRQRMGLRIQIMFAFGLLSLLAAGVAATALWGIVRIRDTAHQAAEVDGRMSRLASQIATQTLLCRRYEKDLFLNIGDNSARADYQSKWNTAFAGLEQVISNVLPAQAGSFALALLHSR
ncbi:MAG: hypothetical protein ACJ8CR_21815, partial [Roseiflexaceae bacterium]